MDQLFCPRKQLSSTNLSICNLQMIKLKEALSKKRQERRQTQIQKKGMANKLNRLKDEEQIVIKEIEKKYGMLQNIYKVRMRKQTEMDVRERNKLRKEAKEEKMKKEERRKEYLCRRSSADECLQANKKSISLQNTVSFKGLNKIYNDEIQKQQTTNKDRNRCTDYDNKKKEERKQLGAKIKNQFIDEYKIKLKQEEARKKRNIEKIRRMSRNQSRKKVSIENQEISKIKLENLIKRAHSVSLIELESEIKRRSQESFKRRSCSRLSEKVRINRKKAVDSTTKSKRSTITNEQFEISNKMLPNKSISEIEKTIRIIQQLQAQHLKKSK